jgi:hypothetical protein
MAVLLMPYLHPNLILPRTEELNYSLYPLILWAKQLFSGKVPLWFADAGLGIPWPIPHTMSHTPLALLFAKLPVYDALSLLLAVHISLQAYFTLRLCRYFDLTSLTSAVVLVSVLLAAPMEYLIASDAAAVYMVWTLLPMLFYSMLKLLEPLDPKQSLGYASLLAFTVGYGILNGHIGVFSTHVLGLALVVLLQPKTFLARWYWFAFAALLALGIGSEKIYVLAREMPYFGQNAIRYQYTFKHSLYYSIWNMFCKPLVVSKQIFSPEYLDILIRYNTSCRTFSFGSPLCALLLLAYIVFRLRRKICWTTVPELQRAMWVMIGACFLVQFTPTALLPIFISASWTFRDPAVLVGLLLAGILCDEWLRPRLKRTYLLLLLGTHLLFLLVGAAFFHYGSNLQSQRKGEPAGVYNALSTASVEYPLHQMIHRALTCSKHAAFCDDQVRRVVYDGLAASYAHDGILVRTGLHLNSLPLHGFQEISYITKGLSLDVIHPSQSKPYGMISTLGFANYRYTPDAFDWVQESPALLDLLGIRVVVGKESARYEANGLTYIGTINPKATIPLVPVAVYANPRAFPRAFFVDESKLRDVKSNEKCPPNANFLTCMDVTSITESTNPWNDPIHVEGENELISLTFMPSSQPRSLLLNSMWRPEWRTNDADLSSYYGLMKLIIPAGKESVTLNYMPERMLYARSMTLLFLAVSLMGIFGQIVRQSLNRITDITELM